MQSNEESSKKVQSINIIPTEGLKQHILGVLEEDNFAIIKKGIEIATEDIKKDLQNERREKEWFRGIVPWLVAGLGCFIGSSCTIFVNHFKLQREYFELRLEKYERDPSSKIPTTKSSK